MRSDCFAYWFQGYFELAVAGGWTCEDVFNEEQVEILQNHIEMVKLANNKLDEAYTFILWLEGVISSYQLLSGEGKIKVIIQIKEKLEKLFEHQLDDEMPGDKEKLKKTHNKGRGRALEQRRGGGREPRFMC